MSLRARLALLYTFIVGGILLVFGTVVYLVVSFTLTRQIDAILSRAASQIIANARVGVVGELNVVNLPELDLSADVYIQVWGLKAEGESGASEVSARKQTPPLIYAGESKR